MTTLVIDNYDSFTWNLVQLFGAIGERPIVRRNDAIALDEIRAMRPSRIVLSPGPGHPEDPARVGVCREIVTELGRTIPILGVCLGHQLVVSAFGGRIIRAPEVMHGKASFVHHDGDGIFAALPLPFEAMRYHSLVADPSAIPACLALTAWCKDGTVMAVRHRRYPVFGVQFHPESIGTAIGPAIVRAFMGTARRDLPS
ncbi:MAG: aminodeoxychorismate/anthranilate synthase component II [Labilithrix sp.]|nr:aminodeoxychorismate/anthranilate synthase component II [Labilithrix sp.]